MKKLTCILFCFAMFSSFIFSGTASADYNRYIEKKQGRTDGFYSDCVLLVCTDNDEIIFEKNINKQTKPASLTKVVTASIVLANCTDVNQKYTVPEQCIRELDGTGSSMSGLKIGEEVTIYDLLCCLLIPSANDAATTLATFISGTNRQDFIDKMNDLAIELGCTNSHFVNCHGLDDDDQYTSAADMAKFLKHAMEFPIFSEIVAKTQYTIPETNLQKERTIKTTNFTLSKGIKEYYCPYSLGGKTGSTSGAGHCLVSMASKDGYNYIAVALNSVKEDLDGDYVDENGAFVDTKAMYDWAFSNLRLVAISNLATIVGEVPVKYGKGTDYVTLYPSENAFSLLPIGTDSSALLVKVKEDTMPNQLTAPISKGDYICRGEVYYAEEPVAEIDLVASTDIGRSFFSVFGTVFHDIVSSVPFKIIAAAALLVLIILILSKKKKSEEPHDKAGTKNNISDMNKVRWKK